MDFVKRAWAEIDIDAAKHNFDYIKSITPNAKIFAVLKADAYGHGAAVLSKYYDKWGTDGFAVSNLCEALEIREICSHKPILILGYAPAENAVDLADNNITQALYSLEYARLLSENAVRANKAIKVYIKLDTGMARIGFNCREDSLPGIEEAIAAASLPGLKVEGVFTHFSSAARTENGDSEFTDRQYELFVKAKERLKQAGIDVVSACCNSAGILNDSEKNFGICRPGIILHGLSPDNSTDKYPELIPVMTLKSVVSNVKTVKCGEPIGYSRTYTAKKEMRVATVSIGYGDGYPRALGNKGYAYVNGKFAPIVGSVCMDQIMINADGIDMKIGDEVEIFGKNVLASELANIGGLVNYELVTGITKRVPRIYVKR